MTWVPQVPGAKSGGLNTQLEHRKKLGELGWEITGQLRIKMFDWFAGKYVRNNIQDKSKVRYPYFMSILV